MSLADSPKCHHSANGSLVFQASRLRQVLGNFTPVFFSRESSHLELHLGAHVGKQNWNFERLEPCWNWTQSRGFNYRMCPPVTIAVTYRCVPCGFINCSAAPWHYFCSRLTECIACNCRSLLPMREDLWWRCDLCQYWGLSIFFRFNEFDGALLLQYKKMMQSAPQYFYQSLETNFGLGVIDVLQFSKALECIKWTMKICRQSEPIYMPSCDALHLRYL